MAIYKHERWISGKHGLNHNKESYAYEQWISGKHHAKLTSFITVSFRRSSRTPPPHVWWVVLSFERGYFADRLSHACPTCKSCFHMPQNQSYRGYVLTTRWIQALYTRWIQDLYTIWIHNSTNEPTIILWTKLNIQQMDTFCRTTEGRSGTNSTEMQHHNL